MLKITIVLKYMPILPTLFLCPWSWAQPVSDRLGIDVHEPQGAYLQAAFDDVDESGMGWVRIDLRWNVVQPQAGVFDWSRYDAIASAAAQRGLKVYASVDSTPAWATSGSEGIGVPSDPQTFYNFVHAAVTRYASTIQHWGMWNEPNLDGFWQGTRQQYIDVILKNGADAAHAANPNAKVGGPELAHLTSGDQDWYYWLQDSIDQASDKLDFVTHHIYGSNSTVNSRLEADTFFGSSPNLWGTVAPSVKEVLEETGWWGRPFWLSETGWQTDSVGLQGQANNYQRLLDDWMSGAANRDWVSKVMFYELGDISGPSLTWGIVDDNRQPKPAYDVIQNFVGVPEPAVGSIVFVAACFTARRGSAPPVNR